MNGVVIACAIALYLMFRHGLRAGEAIMFDAGAISIKQLKRGESGVHRLQEYELKALGELREKYPESFYLFTSERGTKLSTDAIAKIVDRAERLAQLPLPVHPLMLRHSCGYHLAEQGMPTRDIQAYLGHKNIQHTVRYTAANSRRFDQIQG